MSGKRFDSLDGLRGVCAFLVVIFHCDLVLNTGHLLNHGFLSVDVFFVLSGFVISHSYETRLAAGLGAANFMRARLRRLLPTQLVATAIVTAVVLVAFYLGRIGSPAMTGFSMLLAALLGFLLLPDFWFVQDIAFPVNPVLWSLMDELIVNLFFGVWLYRLRTGALFALLLVIWTATCAFAFQSPFGLELGTAGSTFGPGILRATAEFLAGTIVYRLYHRDAFRLVPSISAEYIYCLCFLATCVPTAGPMPAFEISFAMLIPLGMAFLLRSKPPARIFVWLGSISYPLYVVQMAPVTFALAMLPGAPVRHSASLAIPIVGAAVALAWVLKKMIIDRPKMPGLVHATDAI